MVVPSTLEKKKTEKNPPPLPGHVTYVHTYIQPLSRPWTGTMYVVEKKNNKTNCQGEPFCVWENIGQKDRKGMHLDGVGEKKG